MEKISFTPREVRGGGDVLDSRVVTDFTNIDGTLTLTSGTVDDVPVIIGTFVGDYSGIMLTITQNYVAKNDTVTLTATLTDSEGEPISGADIEFYKEV